MRWRKPEKGDDARLAEALGFLEPGDAFRAHRDAPSAAAFLEAAEAAAARLGLAQKFVQRWREEAEGDIEEAAVYAVSDLEYGAEELEELRRDRARDAVWETVYAIAKAIARRLGGELERAGTGSKYIRIDCEESGKTVRIRVSDHAPTRDYDIGVWVEGSPDPYPRQHGWRWADVTVDPDELDIDAVVDRVAELVRNHFEQGR